MTDDLGRFFLWAACAPPRVHNARYVTAATCRWYGKRGMIPACIIKDYIHSDKPIIIIHMYTYILF